MLSSSEGTFLLNTKSGKIWKFSGKDDAFLEIPMTSKGVGSSNTAPTKIDPFAQFGGKANSNPDQTTQKDSSGKPCDKKTDPLCIR